MKFKRKMAKKSGRRSGQPGQTGRTITITELAKLCDITPRHVQRLTPEVFQRARDSDGAELRGRFTLLSVRSYVRHLRSQSKLEDASESEHMGLKIRRARAEAEIVEQRAKQIKAELYHAADIEFAITKMLTYIRQGVLAIPARASRMLIGKKTFREVYDPLMSEITGVLNRLAAPDRETFLQLSASRLASQGVILAAGATQETGRPEDFDGEDSRHE